MDTSASLLQRIQKRGGEAGGQPLVSFYAPLIRRWIGRHVRQPDDVNDLVQQVFHVVVDKLPNFVHDGRPGAFGHWLRSIAVNQLRTFCRARPTPARDAGMSAVLDQLEDPASDLSRQWDREHNDHVARKLLEYVEPEFQPATWQAFCRLVLDDDKPEKVAADLSLPVSAVLIAKARVLQRLRAEARGLLD
jgi:RNA polymerase sigma factor (sigma-70 family)